MNTHEKTVIQPPSPAGDDRDAQRPDGAWGAEPCITAPHNDIPLEAKELNGGFDTLYLSAEGLSARDEYEQEVLESCDPIRSWSAGSDGDVPWLNEGDRVRLTRPSSTAGAKVGGCGTVRSERRKNDLRMIVIDWDEEASPDRDQVLQEEIIPRQRRMVVFTVKTPLGDPLELLDAQGGTCPTFP